MNTIAGNPDMGTPSCRAKYACESGFVCGSANACATAADSTDSPLSSLSLSASLNRNRAGIGRGESICGRVPVRC